MRHSIFSGVRVRRLPTPPVLYYPLTDGFVSVFRRQSYIFGPTYRPKGFRLERGSVRRSTIVITLVAILKPLP